MTKRTEIEYTNKYTDLTRESVLNRVQAAMSDKRYQHVLRVEQTAIQLAKEYGADVEKVSIAAITHDYAKEQSDPEMRDMIISENMDLELLEFGSNIWHGPVGSILVKKQLRVQDEEILEAISNHTIGSPHMSLVEKILYIADYIEPGRDFPEADKARAKAENSLEETIAYIAKETMKNLIENNKKVYPLAIETYNAWVAK